VGDWTPDQIPDQSGRTVLVTGANSGLGLVTARELARARATVLITARTDEKNRSAEAEIRERVPDARLEPLVLDLADLGSVRELAAAVTSSHDRLDVLVNNAGVMMAPRSKTVDGFELHFGTNHLGHFALTGLLLDHIGGADPRVVTVSSLEHRPGRIDFDDLGWEHGYDPRAAYQRSKLANALFGIELDRRLRAAGSPVKSLLAHPGYSATNLQVSGPTGLVKQVLRLGNALLAQSADDGAIPQLYAATAPGVESGEFIGPDGFGEYRGKHPRRVDATDRAHDEELARRLWEVSEGLTGVTYPLARRARA
jgi:NAD(P)-dependent dehydrogenase (short-subunit alcohol dehydrogenase family)